MGHFLFFISSSVYLTHSWRELCLLPLFESGVCGCPLWRVTLASDLCDLVLLRQLRSLD